MTAVVVVVTVSGRGGSPAALSGGPGGKRGGEWAPVVSSSQRCSYEELAWKSGYTLAQSFWGYRARFSGREGRGGT